MHIRFDLPVRRWLHRRSIAWSSPASRSSAGRSLAGGSLIERSPAGGSPAGGSPAGLSPIARKAVALLLAALMFGGWPSATLASRPPNEESEAIRLLNPAPDETVDEVTAVLRWSRDPAAEQYTVFVWRSPAAGQSGNPTADRLLADPTVLRQTTAATEMRLQEILRGAPGLTEYEWAVAAERRVPDQAGQRTVVSSPARLRVQKSFAESGSVPAADPLIQEVSRGVAPAGMSAAPYPAGEEHSILLSNGYRFDPLQGEPSIPQTLQSSPLAPGEKAGYLVQLNGSVVASQREAIEAAGGRIVAYLPHATFLVRMDAAAAAAVGSMNAVRWVGPWHPAYKLSDQPGMDATSGRRELVVLLYPDADLRAEEEAVARAGAAILEATDSGRNRILKIDAEMSRLVEIASRPDVAWIEPWIAPQLTNSNAQWVVQTFASNNRRVWDMGLHGEGQVVHTSDSGIRTSHDMFRDDLVPITGFGQYPAHRKVIAYVKSTEGVVFGDQASASYHGTHTAGTITGDDSPYASDLRDGMAPKAKLYFTDAGGDSTSIIAPADLNLLYQPPYDGNAGGAARISSNSWSAGTNGEYTILDMTADQFLYDHKDFLLFFSTGNDGAPATVGSPATCKNGVGSGATQNGANAILMMPLTSQGPTQDGRTKPTILSPGMSLSSASGAGDNAYQSLTGTSMSCPSKAGATALIRQYFTEGWYPTGAPQPGDAFIPSGALLKAMAISSTDNDMAGLPIPNFATGWGRIKLDNILYFAGDSARVVAVDEAEGVGTAEVVDYRIRVTDGAVPLKITLVWFDHEGAPGALLQLVNNLDLEVTGPDNTVYLGNVVADGESATGGAADFRNVEEGVRVGAPQTGDWTIRVKGTNVPFGPQPYAIAVSGGVGVQAGVVLLDRASYGRDDTVEIRLEDANVSAPVTVLVTSDAEPSGEVIELTGTGGVYTGTIATTAFSAASGDGAISVAHGGQVTVEYADADPAGTAQVSAGVDFEGPVITGVASTNQDVTQTITWSTDVIATARVHYGETPGLGSVSPLDATLATAHEIRVSGLQSETTYYFDVESVDHTGNVTRDDAGGAHYRFSTGPRGDVLLVVGADSFDRTKTDLYIDAFRTRDWEPSVLAGGTIADPQVGDRETGMRSATAVIWQVGQEQYPTFEDSARDSLSAYLDGGGRLAVFSHDVAWANSDPASGYWTPEREAWIADYLHIEWLEDPLTWPAITGIAGDPISDPYQGGVPYSPHREGAAGDEIALVAGTGAGAYVWRNTDATADNIAVRWENGSPNGSPADAVWGGTPTKVVTNCLEWAQIVDAATRVDILDRTLVWLIGNDHPDVVLVSPVAGQTYTNSIFIDWTEQTFGAAQVAEREVSYSVDDGSSWQVIVSGLADSEYLWDTSGLPNSTTYRVRVRVVDDNLPVALRGSATSGAFTIARDGGDTRGPIVVAGSIQSDPNPMSNDSDAALSARLTDDGLGSADVVAAEWSWGPAPADPGSGTAMGGVFDSSTVEVSATVPPSTIPRGVQKVWVRGRDAGGAWGPAAAQEFVVNGSFTSGVPDARALRFEMASGRPNPLRSATTISYSLPSAAVVTLAIYDVAGARVRTLVSERQEAGTRVVQWNGADEAGRPVASGVYFTRLTAGSGQSIVRKIVASR